MNKTLLILAMAGLLTACGGSSGDNHNAGGSNNPKAQLTEQEKVEQKAFYADVAGVWEVAGESNKEKVLIYITPEGDYVMGQATPADGDGKPGIEIGNFEFNPTNKRIHPTVTFDGNGDWGFDDAADENTIYLSYDAQTDKLVLHTPEEDEKEHIANRVENLDNSLVGSWKAPDQVLSIFKDNTYFLLHTGTGDCAKKGLEYGKLELDPITSTLTVSEAYYDETGCTGLVDTDASGKHDIDTFNFKLIDSQLSIQYENEPATEFQRIK